MTADLRHVLVGGGTPVTSVITGRDLLINDDATRFRVPATFTPEGVAATEAAIVAWVAERNETTRSKWKHMRTGAAIRTAAAARTPAGLAEAVEAIVAGLFSWVTPMRFCGLQPVAVAPPLDLPLASVAVRLLMTLWRHGCLLAPAGEARFNLFFGQRHITLDDPTVVGPAAELPAPTGGRAGNARASFSRMALAVAGVQEIGDFSVDVLRLLAKPWSEGDPDIQDAVDALVPGLFEATKRDANRNLTPVLNFVASSQRVAYASRPDIIGLIPKKTYVDVRPDRPQVRMRVGSLPTKDVTFGWITRDFPEAGAWQETLTEYMGSVPGTLDVRNRLSSLARGTRVLLESSSAPLTPIDACRRARDTAAALHAMLAGAGGKAVSKNRNVGHWKPFFAWVITTKGRRADGTVDPDLGNPVDLIQSFGRHTRPAQSTRPRMPGWLMQKAVELIRADDYSWPRTRRVDYFDVVEDGQVKRVWSPVLAELVLLRFLLPIRATQARLLGSGEGDAWVWEPDGVPAPPVDDEAAGDGARGSGRWVANTSRWAPRPGEDAPATGFLRRIWDGEQGTWTNGLYISTNKTADKANGFENLGYEIPWMNAEILALYNRVLRFQQQYNPAKEPKSRAELSREPSIIPADVAPLLPKMHWLFRDAAHPTEPDEPVAPSRVNDFWNDMLVELERRLASDPEVPRNADGSPPQLILEWNPKTYAPRKVRYDGHSVRVTGITRLALGGCPVQVLMMLAGHATWLMTLYYVKLSPSDVRRALDEAEERIEQIDAKDLDEALTTVDPEALRRLRVATSDEGVAQLKSHGEALMAVTDLGLCPNGATLCHIGGKTVHTASAASGIHGPVAGGATNCQSCRFLVSGPQYLGGIIARLNALTVEVIAAGERLRDTQAHRRSVVAEVRRAGAEPPAALLRRLRRAEASAEAAEAHAENMSERWQNLYRLYERCHRALRELMRRDEAPESSGGRHLLVLNGAPQDVQVALRRCTDMALWNRVCFDSEVWDSVDATAAATRRGMRLDHLLAQSGRPAVFAGLTDAERVGVGNAVARWLETRLGVVGANEIYEGRRTLADAGLLEDLDALLPHAAAISPGVAMLPDARRLLPATTA